MLKKLLSIGFTFVSILTAQNTLARTEEFLPPEKAFEIRAQLSAESLKVIFKAAPGYYMYEESMQIRLKDSDQKIINTLYLKHILEQIQPFREILDKCNSKLMKAYSNVKKLKL